MIFLILENILSVIKWLGLYFNWINFCISEVKWKKMPNIYIDMHMAIYQFDGLILFGIFFVKIIYGAIQYNDKPTQINRPYQTEHFDSHCLSG